MSDYEEEDREKYPKRWVMGGQVYDSGPLTPAGIRANIDHTSLEDDYQQAWLDRPVKPMIETPAEESWSDPLEEVKQHAASAFDKHINHLIEHGPEHPDEQLPPWQEKINEMFEHMDQVAFSQAPMQTFETGAVRDTQEGKPRYTLISPKFKRRLAEALTKGAEHYGSHNWHKGIPVERSLDSLLRHLEAFIEGRIDEDHLANAACNLMFMMEFENTPLDDRYDWGK